MIYLKAMLISYQEALPLELSHNNVNITTCNTYLNQKITAHGIMHLQLETGQCLDHQNFQKRTNISTNSSRSHINSSDTYTANQRSNTIRGGEPTVWGRGNGGGESVIQEGGDQYHNKTGPSNGGYVQGVP